MLSSFSFTDIAVTALTAFSTLGAGYLVNKRSARTEHTQTILGEGALELDDRRADGEAYERAQKINQQIVESLQLEVTRLTATIISLRNDLTRQQEHSTQLEGHIRDLELSCRTMQLLLTKAGVTDIPALPPPIL